MAGRAFEREFAVFVDAINKDAPKQIALAAHEGEKAIAQARAAVRGILPGITGVVDGKRNAPYESVRPDGQIVVLFDYMPEIIAALFAELRARSPIGPTGHYRDSHFAMSGGTKLPPLTLPARDTAKVAQQFVVTNPMQYAGRLETGKTKSGGQFIKQMDPHIFESAMKIVQKEFRGVAKFDYLFIDLPSGDQKFTPRRGKPRSSRAGRIARHRIQFPAITIDRII